MKNDFDNLVHFRNWKCVAKVGQYGNGRPALQLFDANTFEPVATASINVPDLPIRDSEIYIKEYSENKGMIQSLIDANIVKENPEEIPFGPFQSIIYKAEMVNPKKWKND